VLRICSFLYFSSLSHLTQKYQNLSLIIQILLKISNIPSSTSQFSSKTLINTIKLFKCVAQNQTVSSISSKKFPITVKNQKYREGEKEETLSVSGSLIRQTSMEFGSKTRRYSRLSLRGFTISTSDFSTAIFASLICLLNGWVFGLHLFYLSIFFSFSFFFRGEKCDSRPVTFLGLQYRSSPSSAVPIGLSKKDFN
jgi:hypothetical protein